MQSSRSFYTDIDLFFLVRALCMRYEICFFSKSSLKKNLFSTGSLHAGSLHAL